MRMGGTPNKQGCRRLVGDPTMPSNSQQRNMNKSVDRPMLFDPSSVAPTSITVPALQQAPSNDTEVSSCVSGNSHHNWLDDYGKQNKDTLAAQDVHTKPINIAAKDPRFHCKRKNKSNDRSSTENHQRQAAPESPPMFPDDPMEGTQVFLAPVIVPPAEADNRRAQGFPSPPMKRSSVFETSNAAIAAAQEAPGLAESSSQETSSLSSHNSSAVSALTSSTTSSMAAALVKRLVDKGSMHSNSKARLQRHPATVRSTPIRIKPRVRPQEVQATDQGYASVAKLSAWLADDPTSTKKVRHVRRGANVIAKSRKFEKDLEGVILEENNIMTGAVKEKKDWLKSAFVHEAAEDEEEDHDCFHHDPNRHMMMMRTKPVNDDDCARSEFVVSNDTASSISVSDKKKWLQNAFRKEDESNGQRQRHFSIKARSDIGPVRESRDDITSRAKSMWKQKSEKRVPEAPMSAQKSVAALSPYNQRLPAIQDTPPRKSLEERMRDAVGPRASAPAPVMAQAAAAAVSHQPQQERHSVVGVVPMVDEDTTSVDFRAARQLLIQRSKNNGNELKVASKVQRRAGKFEQINKDTKRRMSATGLLKSTWETNGSPDKGASDAYTKSFVEDVAPMRSFEELP
ncbi:expressed unknown protein [Seminavis robusta]|uniref:Uncharacterized protein n=1 Tax=Seminavis robusta TaxID=568900 RepID=A0A9N8D485_9STRA|nr:expressed unknown protein [Seminavis robusta]|eukprot:Sro1_g000360.1 n/a (626) ;mRNA; f:104009-105886